MDECGVAERFEWEHQGRRCRGVIRSFVTGRFQMESSAFLDHGAWIETGKDLRQSYGSREEAELALRAYVATHVDQARQLMPSG